MPPTPIKPSVMRSLAGTFSCLPSARAGTMLGKANPAPTAAARPRNCLRVSKVDIGILHGIKNARRESYTHFSARLRHIPAVFAASRGEFLPGRRKCDKIFARPDAFGMVYAIATTDHALDIGTLREIRSSRRRAAAWSNGSVIVSQVLQLPLAVW